MKKIVIAIDSFKGCLTSREAEEAAAEGVRLVYPVCEIICVPVADGGEGMLEVLVAATGGRSVSLTVHDPLMRTIETRYALSGDGRTALIEMAAVSGLPLLAPSERNPWLTTTYGTGELIKDALQRGCRNFIVGIGGSATNDGGLGMLQALGYRFLDRQGNVLGSGGRILGEVAQIDASAAHPALRESRFTVACDVCNPFYGPNGAAWVYAAQKGADTEMIEKLDAGMQSLSTVIKQFTGKDIADYPGAGAAGGIGGAFLAFLDARLKPGICLLLDLLVFSRTLAHADLVLTGEGKADAQTLMGKVPYGILEEARKQAIPVVLLAGSVQDTDELNKAGFAGVYSITPAPVSLKEAMLPEVARDNIKRLVIQLCHTFRSLKM